MPTAASQQVEWNPLSCCKQAYYSEVDETQLMLSPLRKRTPNKKILTKTDQRGARWIRYAINLSLTQINHSHSFWQYFIFKNWRSKIDLDAANDMVNNFNLSPYKLYYAWWLNILKMVMFNATPICTKTTKDYRHVSKATEPHTLVFISVPKSTYNLICTLTY